MDMEGTNQLTGACVFEIDQPWGTGHHGQSNCRLCYPFLCCLTVS